MQAIFGSFSILGALRFQLKPASLLEREGGIPQHKPLSRFIINSTVLVDNGSDKRDVTFKNSCSGTVRTNRHGTQSNINRRIRTPALTYHQGPPQQLNIGSVGRIGVGIGLKTFRTEYQSATVHRKSVPVTRGTEQDALGSHQRIITRNIHATSFGIITEGAQSDNAIHHQLTVIDRDSVVGVQLHIASDMQQAMLVDKNRHFTGLILRRPGIYPDIAIHQIATANNTTAPPGCAILRCRVNSAIDDNKPGITGSGLPQRKHIQPHA